MGRTENPVDHSVPSRGELADFLRAERRASGLTYDHLAERTGVSAATLKRAASGRVVPAEHTVVSFLSACASGPAKITLALSMRQRARRDERGGGARVNPLLIFAPYELAVGLVALHKNAGSPSYREMTRRAGGSHLLPLSSISRILNRRTLPVSQQQMAAFIEGCGVRAGTKAHDEWLAAWSRSREIKELRTGDNYVETIEHMMLNMAQEHSSRQGAIRRRLRQVAKSIDSGLVLAAVQAAAPHLIL
ncbi:helix-turn-helix domain-containing protein [Streptomyces sp. NPDC127114]|uniref:helix-turn-helix domain-containing protein n=1 Tax=Streptomyces sp. NPDC127114 TaxID=3345366 RepID=UPI003631DBF6